jgi:hypothetical protein
MGSGIADEAKLLQLLLVVFLMTIGAALFAQAVQGTRRLILGHPILDGTGTNRTALRTPDIAKAINKLNSASVNLLTCS